MNLYIKNGGSIHVSTGSSENAFCMVFPNGHPEGLIDVEKGSSLELLSGDKTFYLDNDVSASTKTLGALVNTEPSAKGSVKWDGETALNTYRYVKIPYVEEPSPSPSPEDDETVQAVVDMIKALDPNAADYAAKAQEAIDAYNKLSDAQKADDRFKEQTVATKLADAQEAVTAAADKKAADEASALITKLPDDPAKASEADAQAAYAAYMHLTDAQKALLSDAAKKKVAVYGYYYEAKYAKAQKTSLKSVKAKKGRKAVANWKKVSGASGYQLYYKAKGVKAKKVTVKSAKTLKKTVKKLKAGKKYSFKVRPYTNIKDPDGNTVKVYGKWSKVKKAKAKK